jgi:hypothetical protein
MNAFLVKSANEIVNKRSVFVILESMQQIFTKFGIRGVC